MKVNFDYQTIKNISKVGRYSGLDKGLHLVVKPNGKKNWVMRFTYNGKRQDLSLGAFPEVKISDARKKSQDARSKLNQGINPLEERKISKSAAKLSDNLITFEKFALEVIAAKRVEWSNEKHAAQWEYSLRQFAFPVIGNKTLDSIEMDDILKILIPIWHIKTETASRLRGRLEWIFAAAATKKLRTGMNPALWKGLLQTILPAPGKFHKVSHHKALPYKELPEFISRLSQIDSVSALALEFLILNANRTGEVTDALRGEVSDGVWKIPGERMKARLEHRIPLCSRSLEILKIAEIKDPDSKYLFSNNGKKLSNMAMSMLVRRLGFDVTVHGFRSTFRDWISEETNHAAEVAEMALAHTIKNKVEAAYRRGDLFERRRFLMLDWESFCWSIG